MPSKIYWTRQAREDLRAIRDHIARDAPTTASAYVRRLKESVGRLQDFPFAGELVPEKECTTNFLLVRRTKMHARHAEVTE